jgi:predicted secreted protein with PEFG-CTERM motif
LKPVIIIAIAFVLLIPIPVFAVNITIIEVESNPAGYDEGNEWVRLFNPFSNSVDLTGWKISSTHGKTNTYTISENIGSCDSLKIVFSNQFIDNSGESLILYDKSQNVVDSTPIINDTSNDRTTWQGQTPTCVSTQKESPIVEEPIVEEPIVEELPIELELVGFQKIESDKSELWLLTISSFNNGKSATNFFWDYIYLIDSQERIFETEDYFSLQEKGFSITWDDCPSELYSTINAGLSAEEILCYVVPKGIGSSISLDLYNRNIDLCDSSFISDCTMKSFSVTLPQLSEPIVEEPEYLSNGCTADFPYLWEDERCHTTIERVYKEAEMEIFTHETYDFSYEIPSNWIDQSDVSFDQGTTYEVISFPSEFSIENAGDDANMMDVQMALSGMLFQVESPLIYVNFENIPKSKVSVLSEESLEEYVREVIIALQPSAKIDSWAFSHDWGWEVYTMSNYSLNLGLGSGIPYVSEEFTYIFKDRESYNVAYGAPDAYFDEYRPVFEHLVETLVIKSVAIPEFGSIAMLVLVISIVSVVIVSRKFVVMK